MSKKKFTKADMKAAFQAGWDRLMWEEFLSRSPEAPDFKTFMKDLKAANTVADDVPEPTEAPKIDSGIFEHKCESEGCERIVIYDDEPCCYSHSPDSGSSVMGYSARWKAEEKGQETGYFDGPAPSLDQRNKFDAEHFPTEEQ